MHIISRSISARSGPDRVINGVVGGWALYPPLRWGYEVYPGLKVKISRVAPFCVGCVFVLSDMRKDFRPDLEPRSLLCVCAEAAVCDRDMIIPHLLHFLDLFDEIFCAIKD